MKAQPFSFNGATVRARVDQSGRVWFVAGDVCAVLEIRNARDAVARLDDDEKGVATADTPGGTQRVLWVSEGGMYTLVFGSRKPEARAFRRWVTHEVIPEIRRTGGYGEQRKAMEMLGDPAALRGLLGEYAARVEKQAETIAEQAATLEEQAPKVHLHDAILDTSSTFGFREAAKLIREATGVKEPGFRDYLLAANWAYRLAGRLVPKHYGLEHGFVVSRERPYSDPNTGETKAAVTLRVTQKGISHAIRRLAEAA